MATYRFKDFKLDVEVPSSAPSFFSELIQNGGWERYECEIIHKAVKARHRVLEGGAGLGVTSALIGKQASFAIAFEANPTLAKVAAKNQGINHSRTKIVNAAIGTSDSYANFNFMPDWWDSKISKSKTSKTSRVKVLDAKKIIDKYNINALILDVEGEEENIIPSIDLSKIDLAIIELHGHIDKKKVIKLLDDSGLKRKNDMAKSDHSVVWMERPKNRFAKIRQVIKI